MPEELLERLRRFQTDAIPQHRSHFRLLVDDAPSIATGLHGCEVELPGDDLMSELVEPVLPGSIGPAAASCE
jgi:hypothetical protein